jgi:uncharacterized membrane protein
MLQKAAHNSRIDSGGLSSLPIIQKTSPTSVRLVLTISVITMGNFLLFGFCWARIRAGYCLRGSIVVVVVVVVVVSDMDMDVGDIARQQSKVQQVEEDAPWRT